MASDSTTTVTTKASIASFGGTLLKLSHHADKTVQCEMAFNLFLPPQVTTTTPKKRQTDSSGGVEHGGGTSVQEGKKKVPLLIYLSGLTCTPDNCAEKGFFQHAAAERGIAVLYPDTSPRNIDIPGQDASYDFGSGAGFYLDATTPPWSTHYRMYSYVTSELPDTVFTAFADVLDRDRVAITGHSMGGHGALTLYLKNPDKYRSCSAFAPIANPLAAPWGQKAFRGYLGGDGGEKGGEKGGEDGKGKEASWKVRGKEYDATELIKKWKGGPLDVLIDVGTADTFYKQGQLLPENLAAAAKEAGIVSSSSASSSASSSGLTIRFQDGYDHSYFTMASFADDHVAHAAKYLFAD